MVGTCSSRVGNEKIYSENLWKTRIGRPNIRVDCGAISPITEIARKEHLHPSND
jgi:hypothetical protein